MPWQAHLFIGERVHDYAEARAVYKKLAPKLSLPGDPGEEAEDDGEWPEIPMELVLYNKTYHVTCYLRVVLEGGYRFPSTSKNPENSCALVGIPLTQRYSPSILDRAYSHGRGDPFEINIGEVVELLNQVRIVWPDAQFLVCDIFH